MSFQRTIGIYAYASRVGDTFGGIESHATHIATALRNAGFRVCVHCLSVENAGLAIGETSAALPCPREVDENLWEYLPANGPGLEGCIAENTDVSRSLGEELILAFGTRDGFLFQVSLSAAELLRVPVVSFVYFTFEERWFRSHFTSRTRSIPGVSSTHEQDEILTHGQRTLESVLAKSALVIVPTHYVKGQLSGMFAPTLLTKVAVCYHGVDTKLFSCTPPWGPTKHFLHVSRLSVPFAALKNFAWTCKIIQLLAQHDQGYSVTFVGSGNGALAICNFAKENNLTDQIAVSGFVDQSTLVRHYAESSILLVPSMMEAGCTVIVEAVLSNCLPVALDHAGNSEVMEGLGLTQCLLPPEVQRVHPNVTSVIPSTDTALSLLPRLISDFNHTASLLQSAKDVAVRRYSLSVTTDRLLQLLASKGLLE